MSWGHRHLVVWDPTGEWTQLPKGPLLAYDCKSARRLFSARLVVLAPVTTSTATTDTY
jgi:hypothetical protein